MMKTQKDIIVVACILGMLGVGIGAFGAHALKGILMANNRLDTFELAVRYHFFHLLSLLAIGATFQLCNVTFLKWSANLLLVGSLLFSGSLYVLAIFNQTAVAIVTPFGGLFLIAGWALAAYGFYKK
jgi:uncharacterized membrane protein YgdD (TMEM256/DUF423 family)